MKQIRESKFSKIVAYYLIMMMVLQIVAPTSAYALTSGPTQPEFNAFTPIGTSDMVDLASGDFNYNIPIMDVGGYPINLAYNSGVSMDQEASWTGLGWNLNVGQISRQMRGLPDDFNGDPMVYENNMKPNETYGGSAGFQVGIFGQNEVDEKGKANLSLGVKYNNYDGIGVSLSGGFSYQMHDNVNVGMQMETSVSEGASISPTVSFNAKNTKLDSKNYNLGADLGVSYNSRKGVEEFSYGMSVTKKKADKDLTMLKQVDKVGRFGGGQMSGSVSFANASYTPTKRVEMKATNFLFNLNLGVQVFGTAPSSKFSGYANIQGIADSEKFKVERGFGYENTKSGTSNDILDFNREKDRTVNKSTTSLPQANYTYDLYSIQSQGLSGMFRPYKGQVGYLYDNSKTDKSDAGQFGLETEPGTAGHWGFNATYTNTNSSTGPWYGNNYAIGRFSPKSQNEPLYEETFFKTIGGTHVDNDFRNFDDSGKYTAVNLSLDGSKFGRRLNPTYENGSDTITTTRPLVRAERLKRNQTIQKLTRKEAISYGFKTQFSPYAKKHHTAEIRVTNENGDRYVFGRALYNTTKKETTFDVSGRDRDINDLRKGTVNYGAGDNSAGNNRNGDRYFNRVTTPGYAHSYLITSVLSSDYQDLTGDGPSDDDLGNYTKFKYTKNNDIYKWRTPYGSNEANYDEGLKSDPHDNKGSYIYGEKEIVYVEKIETKTHVAIFTMSKRNDGYGVKGENGGRDDSNAMYKLDKISLYAKPEYLAHIDDLEKAIPIKEAHFEYDYSLCQGIENNIHNGNNAYVGQQGKLTLKKVYFTYKDSKMGIHTPYVFKYQNNYDFDSKSFDVWGGYKPASTNLRNDPTQGDLSNAEYAYVDQSNAVDPLDQERFADKYATAWQLNSIQLPSGGEIKIKSEADDYAYVQDKEAMQMFKVIGMSDNGGELKNESDIDKKNRVYSLSTQNSYIHVKLDHPVNNPDEFKQKYIRGLANDVVYFRFLLNMSDPTPLPGADRSNKYEYVTGYLNFGNLDANNIKVYGDEVAIPIKDVKKGDGATANIDVSPIAKAGWFFGRSNLSRLVFGISNEMTTTDLKSIVFEIIGAIPSALQILTSPNSRLMLKGIASRFVPGKSWVRLMHPDGKKIGGGSRVKEIKLVDEWDVMTSNNDNPLYEQSYGQEYSYELTNYNPDGSVKSKKSSGVATYEPLGCKENPFNRPFYDKGNKTGLLAPSDQNYAELPFGESFFPSPKITYSQVSVKNLDRERKDGNTVVKVKKHATGNVVTKFFTSKDYPTIVDYTWLKSKYDKSPLGSILKINAKDHLTMSQGFSIHTNDMDGKMRSQEVFDEAKSLISGTKYVYSNKVNPEVNSGLLNNEVTTIDSKGKVENKIVGVDYDITNDFRESVTKSKTPGVRFNTEGIPLTLILLIVPIPLPTFNQHESKLKMAATTKVVHSTGILRETIAFEDNASVSTKNLAWDAETGQVLVTETVNEYNDKYYSFNNPAYWAYPGMSQAAKNIGMTWGISESGGNYLLDKGHSAKERLTPGDELWLNPETPDRVGDEPNKPFKAWVASVENNGSFKLIDKQGLLVDKTTFSKGSMKVIRSGYRNMQTASMASITSLTNPLLKQGLPATAPEQLVHNINENGVLFEQSAWDKYKIINASAIEYSNLWESACECDMPNMRHKNGKLVFEYEIPLGQDEDIDDKIERAYNPYIYNILGNWRAKKSFAYLTGRYHAAKPTPRVSGFFKDFSPYYYYNAALGAWQINTANANKWTFASEVVGYTPYGQEIENKDALDRYSSALYGYNNRFPVAVASNTKYRELASDGFEDYNLATCTEKSHFDFKEALQIHKVSVSTKHAHTGKSSLRVEPKDTARIVKKITNCTTPNK